MNEFWGVPSHIYTQQSYLAKIDLDNSTFLQENPIFKAIQITQMGIKTGYSQEKYGAVQVNFGKV